MVKLIEPDDYTLEHEGVVWDVYAGTHRVHYRCKHVPLWVVTWSDWNDPQVMSEEHPNGIPAHPVCPHPFDNCGHLEIVAGCHDRHSHDPKRVPQKVLG